MSREENIARIALKAKEMGVTKAEALQYILATVQHETNDTFMPIKEAYWLSESWRKLYLKYYPYYGRGFVQITHLENYQKFSKLLNIDMVKKPDLALEFDNALFILIHGMIEGSFTGKKLGDYFGDFGSDFVGARRIINGKDKAEKIALLAQKFKI
jgi:predicted chitinase